MNYSSILSLIQQPFIQVRIKAFWTIKSNKLSSVRPESLTIALITLLEPNEHNRLHSRENGFISFDVYAEVEKAKVFWA